MTPAHRETLETMVATTEATPGAAPGALAAAQAVRAVLAEVDRLTAEAAVEEHACRAGSAMERDALVKAVLGREGVLEDAMAEAKRLRAEVADLRAKGRTSAAQALRLRVLHRDARGSVREELARQMRELAAALAAADGDDHE